MNNFKLIKKENLLSNLNIFKKKNICAMVKANAYGHGIKEIVKILDERVEFFGVANEDEGVEARRYTKKPILVVGRTKSYLKCKRNNLDVMVESVEDVKNATRCGLRDNLHLKINCGMNRYGVSSVEEAKKLSMFLQENDIGLKTICTHFSNTSDMGQTEQQYQKFCEMKRFFKNTRVCLGGSGVIDYDFDYDIIRVGIGLYGYEKDGLLPIMEISSYVSKVLFVKKEEYIGYGKSFKAVEDGFYAVIPVGYADGLRRCLSGKFSVLINGKLFKSVGNICMDAFFVKVDEEVEVGSEVVVMKNVEKMAKVSKTIPYEILTGFSNFRGKTKIV